jgi:beta-glucosidase
MTLQEKLDYIHGVPPSPGFPDSTSASIAAIPRVGLPEIRTTDGPQGVRVPLLPSTAHPGAIVVAASWNPERAWDRGVGIGRDCRSRGFHIWLGPGVNIYRVPVGGRNSEYCSGEDPYLGSQLAVPLVEGAQAQGVIANSKHYTANNQEFNRGSINEYIDQRTLREIYLPVFESTVHVGGVGTVMAAYNQVNGQFCAQNSFLLSQVLVNDWGFRGFRMSDWGAVHDGLQAALAGLDLEMPGTGTGGQAQMSYATLLPYVQSGLLPLATVDDKVRRILREIITFGFLDREQLDPSIPRDDPISAQAGLDTAREGITLLKNDSDLLPLASGQGKSVAVVGRYALGAPPKASGSGYVQPAHYTSELDGIRQAAQAAGGQVRVDFLSGVGNLDFGSSSFQHTDARGATQGLLAQYFLNQDLSGDPAVTRVEPRLNLAFPGDLPPQVAGKAFSARWTGSFVPPVTGAYAIRLGYSSNARLYVNGNLVVDQWNVPVGFLGLAGSNAQEFTFQAGQPVSVVVEFKGTGSFGISARIFFGVATDVGLAWTSLEAPPNLSTYDAVVILAGFSEIYEGEGLDRSYALPEAQDTLIHNLSKANPHTAVILHGGGGMDVQKWVDQVPALLHAYFPGEDGGKALGEILFGQVNPSGKLPFTFEKSFKDNPAYSYYPASDPAGTFVVYGEGIFVGYRGYEKNGVQPQFPFGFGLSYTTFAYSDLDIEPAAKKEDDREQPGDREEHGLTKTEFKEDKGEDHDLVKVSFTVTNTGKRAGAEIAELYVGEKDPTVPRPIKELKGFKKVFLQPGDSRRVTLELDQRSFAFFDTTKHLWIAEPDIYNILVGASSQDIRLNGQFKLQSELTSKP